MLSRDGGMELGHGPLRSEIERSSIRVYKVDLNAKGRTLNNSGEWSSARQVYRALEELGIDLKELVPATWAPLSRRAPGKGPVLKRKR